MFTVMSLQCSFFFHFKLKHTFLKFQTVPPHNSSRIQVKRFTVGEFVIGGSDYSLDSYRSRLDFFSFSVRYLSSPIEKSFDIKTLWVKSRKDVSRQNIKIRLVNTL